MADISSLGNLNSSDPIDAAEYAEASTGFQLPEAGEYILRAPETFTFGATKNGDLSIQIDPVIVGPTHENFTVRFTRVSARQWTNKQGKKASQAGNFLRAVGYTGDIPGDPQVLANLVEQYANATFRAKLDWKAFNKRTQTETKGMSSFPVVNGVRQSFLVDSEVKDEAGNPKRVLANLEVVDYIPAVS